MATRVEKIIDVIFKGDDQLSSTVRGISGGFSSLNEAVVGAAEPFAKIADGVLKADAALAALAVGGLAVAFSKSTEFEASMVELQKVVGDFPDDLEAAKKASFELSAEYGQSASEILLSTADFKQAGFEIEDAMTLTKNALDLVIAGGLEASEASSLLVATLKGFDAPASEAARLIDILNEVSNKYATNVEELAIGMSKLSPIASTMGFTFEETAGVLTPVIEVFRSGSEAAIALKTGLLRLLDDSKPVRDALKELGVRQKDANGQLRSGKDILADVSKAFETTDTNQKLYFASQLVGIQQSARMVEVFDGLAKSTAVTADAMESAGSASTEVAARLQTAEVAVGRFAQSFSLLAITVGDEFREAAKEAIAGGAEIQNAIRDLVSDDAFKPFFDLLRKSSTELSDLLFGIAKALPEAFEQVDFSPLLDALEDLRDEFGAFFEGIDLKKPEDLADAIQFVVDSIASLIEVTQGMVQAFRPFIEGILSTVEAYNEMSAADKKASGQVLATAKLIVDAGVLIAGAFALIGEHAEAVQRVFDVAFGSIKVAINTVQLKMDEFAQNVLTIFTKLLDGVVKIRQFFGTEYEAIEEFNQGLKFVLEGVKKTMAQNLEELNDGAEQMKRGFTGVRKEVDKVKSSVEDIPDKKGVEVEVKVEDRGLSLEQFQNSIEELDNEVIVIDGKIVPAPENKANVEEIKGDVERLSDEDITIEALIAKIESGELDKVKSQIEEVKEKSPIEVDTKLKKISKEELRVVELQAETIQADLKFTAEIDTAQIQADAEVLKATFESIGKTISAVSDNVSTMFGFLAQAPNLAKDLFFRDAFQQQMEIQQQLIQSQIDLNEAQIEFVEAKTRALENSEGLIRVTADGLEPELEAFMWRILERVQVRATEVASEFLLGMGTT